MLLRRGLKKIKDSVPIQTVILVFGLISVVLVTGMIGVPYIGANTKRQPFSMWHQFQHSVGIKSWYCQTEKLKVYENLRQQLDNRMWAFCCHNVIGNFY
ncbi:hypothetical protein ROHU_022457 [Labeo rohita]|uniref:Uncharacterized protein n=1 Tax=Labeo rohita TaxID=84645 RepID=A0A498MWL6_LABRO|nr:hypothetical protein ROHU_022457 [Labeo rohita]